MLITRYITVNANQRLGSEEFKVLVTISYDERGDMHMQLYHPDTKLPKDYQCDFAVEVNQANIPYLQINTNVPDEFFKKSQLGKAKKFGQLSGKYYGRKEA